MALFRSYCCIAVLFGALSVATAEQNGFSLRYSRRLMQGLGSDCWGSCHIEGCDVCFKISCEPRCVSASPPEATGSADCISEGGNPNEDECIGKTKSFASPDSVSSSSTSEGTNGVSNGSSQSTANGGPDSIAHTETKVEISEGRSVASSSSVVVGTG